MACRVGITTDPQRREQEWRNRHPYMRNWRILNQCPTKSEAQQLEDGYIRRYGCQGSPGGGGIEFGTWHVYYFEY